VEGISLNRHLKQLPIGKGELLRHGEKLAILAIGSTVYPALAAADALEEEGLQCSVVNARYAKPLDTDLILETASTTKRLLTVEENTLAGGFGSAVLELVSETGLENVKVECLGLPDGFIEHGTQEIFRSLFDLDAESIAQRIRKSLPEFIVESSIRQREGIIR